MVYLINYLLSPQKNVLGQVKQSVWKVHNDVFLLPRIEIILILYTMSVKIVFFFI